ncbi:MAG: TonB-dependent receptor [Bacteroidales bacterium]|nr:TonB-dependent receptor [Bacteroidales bacterium]
MRNKILIPTLFFLFICGWINAQEKPVTIGAEYDGLNWSQFVKQVESTYDVRFFYQPDSIPELTLSIKKDSIKLLTALQTNLAPFNIKVSVDGQNNYFILKNRHWDTHLADAFFYAPIEAKEESPGEDTTSQKKKQTEYLSTHKDYIHKTVVVGSRKKGYGKPGAIIRGRIVSSEDNQPIPMATLQIEETNTYATTNEEGYYKIRVKKGKYTLAVNSIGRHEKKFKMNVLSDGRLDISLDTKMFMLDEAVITSGKHHNVRSTQMGFEKITPKRIKDIPVVLGEKDLVKVALLLPGIQTVGEASSGFNVRGSPVDQNLFYIDDVPVYNVSHLFGFFSAFNSDAVSEFSLYKSNIPIEYGGRLSSIFDVEARTGDFEKFSARGGISPITSRILVEGPIKKNKSSYMIGLRSTYSDWILKQVKDPDIRNSSAFFADAVANFSFNPDKNNSVSIFAYGSMDDAELAIGTRNKYSNKGASVHWKHKFSPRHQANFKLVNSNYSFEEENDEIAYKANKQSFELNHSEVKADMNFDISETFTLNYGVNSIYYQLDQGELLPLFPESLIEEKSFEPEQGIENSLYLGADWKLSDKFDISGGLRYTMYSYLGPKTVYNYLDGFPRERQNITDTLAFGSNENIKTYNSLDFRMGAKYMFNEDFSVKASFNRLHQYMFLLSNTVSVSPTDKWKLVDQHIEPMVGDQYSVGLYHNFLHNLLETSVEAYYKKVDNLVEYEDGAELQANETPEAEIVQGDLDAWGIEFMLKKPDGKLNGWINYTYSNTSVLVNNPVTGENNNFGLAYPANYDKPHALNLVLNYKLSRRISFSTNVVYSTGRPITYPTAIYFQDDTEVTNFSLRNEYRLPGYFRADLSINVEGNLKKEKFAHGSWAISFYNITGRKNAYSVYFRNEDGRIKGYKLSIFGTVIPSITYNFKLGNYED